MSRTDYTKVQLIELMEKAYACMSDDYQDTLAKLRAADFRELGSGNYGSAWCHRSVKGWCIKVCGRVDGDSYPAYVHWAMANPMPGLPEFKFASFSAQHDVFMVMLPQYEKFDVPSDVYYLPEKHTPLLKDYFMSRAACYGGELDYFDRPLADSPIVLASRKAHEFFNGIIDWDLHAGNFMVDPETGLLILTDPIHQGDNNTIINKVYGREGIAQSWGRQLNLNLPETREFPSLKLGAFDDALLAELAAPVDFGRIDARIAARGFPNLQQIPKDLQQVKPRRFEHQFRNDMLRILPTGARVVRNRDMGRMMYVEEVFGADGQLLAVDHWPFDHGARHIGMGIDHVARAAEWIKHNGVNPEQAKQLGREAQQWTDERLRGMHEVVFAQFLPPDINVRFDKMNEELVEKNIQHWHVPVEVLRVIRDQYKIEQDNLARVGWGGRFANAVKQVRGFI